MNLLTVWLQSILCCHQALIAFCVAGFVPVCLVSMFVRWISMSHFLWAFLSKVVFLWQTTAKTTTKMCHSFTMHCSFCLCHIWVSDLFVMNGCNLWLVVNLIMIFKLSPAQTQAINYFKHLHWALEENLFWVLQMHKTSPKETQIFKFFQDLYFGPSTGGNTHTSTLLYKADTILME